MSDPYNKDTEIRIALNLTCMYLDNMQSKGQLDETGSNLLDRLRAVMDLPEWHSIDNPPEIEDVGK